MTDRFRASFLPLTCALLAIPGLHAQTAAKAAPAAATVTAPGTDRAASYYHYGLAKIYEQQFLASGRQDLATPSASVASVGLHLDSAGCNDVSGYAWVDLPDVRGGLPLGVGVDSTEYI